MQQTRIKKKHRSIFKTLNDAFFGDVRYGDVSAPFFGYVMLLIVIGLVMMSSASYAWAHEKMGDGLYYAKSQALSAGIGIVAMFLLAKMDYHNFKKIKVPGLKRFNIASFLYVLGAVLLALVFVPGLGVDEGGTMGAKRWLKLGPLPIFQPSEVAKFAIVIFFAYLMEKRADEMNKFWKGLVVCGLFLIPYVGLIIAEPHLSGTIVIGAIAAALIICGGANKWHLILGLGIPIAAFTIYVLWQKNVPDSYVARRFASWIDPFADMRGSGWQTANSLIAIGSGGLFGLGFGASRQKNLYLPETQNDFIFPVICEELGFVGATLVMLVFLLLIIEGYSIAARCQDRFGMLIAAGFTTHIGIQAFLNIAVVSNLVPNTGVSLPFFSYGGTALIMQMAEMGIILNISRKRYYPEPDDEPEQEAV